MAGNRAVSSLVARPGTSAPVQRDGTDTLAPPSTAASSTPAVTTPITTSSSNTAAAGSGGTATAGSSASASAISAPVTAPASVYRTATPERALIGAAGTTWKGVKKKYLGAEAGADGPGTMKRIVDYRKLYVDELLAKMKATYGVGARAVGSTALSSDYDVTFLGPMQAAAPAVVGFNKQFREDWSSESGTVFDTNVYAEDFLGGKPAGAKRDDEATKMTTAGQAEDEQIQDINALVKARKNMSKGNWSMFVNRIVFSLPEAQQATARKQFDAADATFRTSYVGSLIGRLPEQKVKALRKAGKSDSQIVEELESGAEGVEAANREYEAQLMEVGRLEAARAALAGDPTAATGSPRWSQLTIEIRKAKSKAMLFANEPYFSAGTLYHVVGNMQGAWKVELGAPEYFQSANENFGDFKKEIAHHGGGDATGAEFVHFAVASSKYAFRFLDAAVHLKVSGIKLTKPVEALRDSEGRLLAIRQGEALDADNKRIDERAIGAGRDDAGALRKKDVAGNATGDAVPTSKDYRTISEHDKEEHAKGYVAEMGVGSISALDRKLTEVSIELNVEARKAGQKTS
ncbi:MAG: hypothetical protein JWM85_640 [Acidimicrobiaceae bacterium]|nr:hypothetical protein [Acidimicrobiaceae bacterium]